MGETAVVERAEQAVAARPWASQLFDGLVIALGAVVGIPAVVRFFVDADAERAVLLLGIPLIAIMSAFPLLMSRASNGIEVGFDSCVLVFLALVAAPHEALAVWALGTVVAQLLTSKRVAVKLFNIGLTTGAGALAVQVIAAFRGNTAASLRELAGVGLACAGYFLYDYILSGISVALEDREKVLDVLVSPGAVLALGAFVAIDTLGYLGAVIARSLPPWTAVLLGVPVVTILVAARSLSRGREHRRRLGSLFAAAAGAQALRTPDEVLGALHRAAREVLGEQRVQLRDRPPGPGEVGSRVSAAPAPTWVVGPARDRARASIDADQQMLDTLATLADEALARIRLVDDMAHLARHDALTGLANRSLFQDRVEHALQLHGRHGRLVAVLYCDLDGFKAINDRFGHEAGDGLLRDVAVRLRDCLRPSDTVARLGGDEFAVLLEEAGSEGGVRDVCARILQAMEADFDVAGHLTSVGTSIGVALSDDLEAGPTGSPTDALMRNADMAMYRAKALGKGRFEIYRPVLRDESLRRIELLEALRYAVDDGQLRLHYQPVVDLATGEVDGVEALVRWQRDGVLETPAAFIEAAEESGLILALGAWVLEQAARDAPALRAAAGRPVSVAVNVAAPQLRDPALHELVQRALEAVGPGAVLVLEMTERVFIGDDDETLARLAALQATGAVVAIDDFGTGFSSVGYLQALPADVLKIDRVFTARLDSDPRSLALVQAMVLMGEALGLRVVAEGIERPSQAQLVRSVGCTLGQGYLFARPLPLDEMCQALAAGPLRHGDRDLLAAAD